MFSISCIFNLKGVLNIFALGKIGKVKLELQPEVNVKIILDDGTDIDDDDTMQACEAGSMFNFVPDGEHWSPLASTTDNRYLCHQMPQGAGVSRLCLWKSKTSITHYSITYYMV